MADQYPIKPRLGRIGDQGRGSHRRLTRSIRKIAALSPKRSSKRGFSGQRLGRGSAAARASAFRRHPFSKLRMRRVVVKTYIARASKGIGKTAFKAHLKYIQRDGVERDGTGGELYDKTKEKN